MTTINPNKDEEGGFNLIVKQISEIMGLNENVKEGGS